MREILFRGKAIDGNWYYGVPLVFTEDYVCMTAPHTYNKKVEANTVGQFTGLLDKNSNKIFEGDIVKDIVGRMKAVEFYNGRYYPFISFPESTYWNTDEVEVIGNIHDNPELLRTPQNDEVRE